MWFFDTWGNLSHGDIIEDAKVPEEMGQYVYVDTYSDIAQCHLGKTIVKKDRMFNTKEECIENRKQQDEKEIKGFMEFIKTPDDLVNFMLEEDMGRDDYSNARVAAIRRAKELGFRLRVEN